MAQLRIHLFGAPHCDKDGQAVDFVRRKTLALVAYLAATGQPHERDALAALFWPDYDSSTARANLRRTLSRLKEALGDDLLDVSRAQVALAPGAAIWLDVADFQNRLAAVDSHRHAPAELCDDCQHALCEAAALYTADFMAGFSLPDSPAFDEWQFFLSESLRQALTNALQMLVDWYSARGEYERAIEHARRLVALDTWHEPAHVQLMQLYAQAGQPTAALRQYEVLARALAEELGAEPEPETIALVEAIKNRRHPVRPAADTAPAWLAPDSETAQPGPAPGGAQSPAPRHNLPAEITPFVGRRKELAETTQLALDGGGQKLISMVGPGGIGKTRLAIQVGLRAVDNFRDGVCFVPLAGLNSSDYLVPLLAEKLGVRLYPGKDAQQQLLDHLHPRQILLVLDNFEHLLDASGLVREILQAAPEVRVLVTSRERLNVSGELVYAIGAMEFPQQHDTGGLLDYDAVELFVQSAHLTDPGFEVHEDNQDDISRICQLVEGMPLALVLAAGWLGVLSLPEIAAEITASLDFLETELRDVPERQRSVRAAFESSWKRLPADDQQAFMKLCVFRGGFTRHAAETVAGARLPVLRHLVNRSFVAAGADGRFSIHELLRQYGLLRAQQSPADYAQTCLSHSDYYITVLRERAVVIKEHRQQETLADIAADIDNVRVAWDHAVARRDWPAIDPVAECYWLFCEFRGALAAGEAAFRHALQALAPGAPARSDPPGDGAALAGFLMAGAGCLQGRQGNFEAGVAAMRQGITWLRGAETPDRQKLSFALAWLAFVLVVQGRYDEAQGYAEESLSYFPETGDRWLKAGCLRLTGASHLYRGQLEDAERTLQSCLAVCEETGERRIRTYATTNLGQIALLRGDYPEAQRRLDEALQITYVLNDLLSRAELLREQARLALLLGDAQRAEENVEQSMALYRQIGRRDTGTVLVMLGDIRRAQGDTAAAEWLYQEGLERSRAADHRPDIARCLSQWGVLECGRGSYSLAERYQRDALAIWQDAGNEVEIAAVQRHLGHILATAGGERGTEAGQHYADALALALRHQLAPVALDVLVGSAAHLRHTMTAGEAIELLVLAARHPASEIDTRRRAETLLAELVPGEDDWADGGAPPDVASLDWTRAAAQLAESFRHHTG